MTTTKQIKDQAREAFQVEVIEPHSYSNERDANGLYTEPGLQQTWRSFCQGFTAAWEASTPSSRWAENGSPDPHGDAYNSCERARLPMGHMTDDELANAVYLLAPHTSLGSIPYLTAAKERIRWLSRRLADRRVALPIGDQVQEVANRVCGHVPEGWVIDLAMENGAAWVEAFDPDGHLVELPDSADKSLIEQLNEALCVAIGGPRSIQQEGKGDE